MRLSWEYWIGRRYVCSRSTNGFISLISAISILGIAIAVAVLMVVLSVVNGFERELRDRLLAMSAHASIEHPDGRLADWPGWVELAESRMDVTAAAPFVDGQGLLVFGNALTGAEFRGVEPTLENSVSGVGDTVVEGELTTLRAGDYNIILGNELASVLGAGVNDRVTVTLAEGVVTPAGIVPRTRSFTVSGIYRVGMYEFDRRLAFIHLQDAQRLFRKSTDVTGVRLAVTDVFDAPNIVRETALDGGGGVLVSDWTRHHVNFFRSIQITKSILFVILLMVIAVAAFNIVSTLVMVVKDKQSDIAILRTAGATPGDVMRIFVAQGSVIGIVGAVAGMIIGVLLALNLEHIVQFMEGFFGIKILAADVYFISDLPSDLRVSDVIRITSIALVLALLSTLYPAWRGAKTMPAETLRYD